MRPLADRRIRRSWSYVESKENEMGTTTKYNTYKLSQSLLAAGCARTDKRCFNKIVVFKN